MKKERVEEADKKECLREEFSFRGLFYSFNNQPFRHFTSTDSFRRIISEQNEER
jgi:hypothetical protein